ncbi:elongation factor G [bacterium]|nr:elongation factor G [FCB group bacterium]MBL7191158.1 elongation factor G [bacterium]
MIETSKIRNLAVIGHSGSGKTTLTEAFMFDTGKITRMGSTESGNTLSDYRKEEIERKISVSSTLMTTDHENYRLNIIDTPGFLDFLAEVKGALRVVDCALLVVNAQSGVEVGAEQVWEYSQEYELPRMIVINNLDRENAKFDETLRELQEEFGKGISPIQFPANQGEGFNEIVDLLKMKILRFDRDGKGNYTEEEIPPDLADKANEMRQTALENAAEVDDELLETFFSEGDLTQEQFETGLRKGIVNGTIVPVFCNSASKNIGPSRILELINQLAPSPMDLLIRLEKDETEDFESGAPTAAIVWKTVSEGHVGELSFLRVYTGKVESGIELKNTSSGSVEKIGQIFTMQGKNRKQVDMLGPGEMGALVKLKATHTGDTLGDPKNPIKLQGIRFPEPVIRIAVEPKAKGDEEKISTGLQSLHDEDPSFVFAYDPELRQTIVAGIGETHLDIIIGRLKDRFSVDVDRIDPKIPYRETIKASADAEGKHKKQSGGRGQFGVVNVKLEPSARGEEFEFVNAISGGAIPGKFIPAVEKGIRERMERGVIAGYKVVDVKVTLFDGKFHDVDSSELAFKIAGSLGFTNAFVKCKPVMLEPIYDLEVRVPEEYMGDVMGDISSRRGKIQGMEASGKMQVIKAKAPLAEINKYSTSLRSMTQGRGMHRQKLSHYEDVPREIQDKLVEEYEKSRAEGGGS